MPQNVPQKCGTVAQGFKSVAQKVWAHDFESKIFRRKLKSNFDWVNVIKDRYIPCVADLISKI